MKKIVHILFAAALLLPAFNVSAQQNLRSAYFLDGYNFRYKMNPALAPERPFFSMPLLGNLIAEVVTIKKICTSEILLSADIECRQQ